MKKLALLAAAAVMVGFAGSAGAGELSMPASKAAYMYGNIQLMTEAAVEAVEFGNNIVDVDSNEVAVMTVYLKTANQSEIAMDLSLVCALWNENVASSKGGKKETSSTDNELAIRINVDSFKTNGTPLGAATVVPERIVYCEQDVDLSATFQGIFTTDESFVADAWRLTAENTTLFESGEDPENDGLVGTFYLSEADCENAGDGDDGGIGTDANTCEVIVDATFLNTCLFLHEGRILLIEECLTPEEVALVLSTTHANAFNWLALDVPAGIQRITITADIESRAEIETERAGGFADDSTTSAAARAILSDMALFAEEVRLVKDSIVTCNNASSEEILWCSDADDDGDGVHDFIDACPEDAGSFIGDLVDNDSGGETDESEIAAGRDVCDAGDDDV